MASIFRPHEPGHVLATLPRMLNGMSDGNFYYRAHALVDASLCPAVFMDPNVPCYRV